MIIHKAEIIEANKNYLPDYIPIPPPAPTGSITTPGTTQLQVAQDRIEVWPLSEPDTWHYTVTFDLKMAIAAVKAPDEYSFLEKTAKGIFNVIGAAASGNLEGVVVNGATMLTSTVTAVEKVVATDSKSFNDPFVVPVNTKENCRYAMSATITGHSVITDLHDRDGANPFVSESDEVARITATLKLCDQGPFDKGGVVDQGNSRTTSLSSNCGTEFNVEGPTRAYTISGRTQCDCMPATVLLTEAKPDIAVATDGALLGAMSGITITRVELEYWEYPCNVYGYGYGHGYQPGYGGYGGRTVGASHLEPRVPARVVRRREIGTPDTSVSRPSGQ